jgi:fructose-1,6-bisphosphatase/inositol monophosphatase family enzyme
VSWELAEQLGEVGRAVRAAVGVPLGATDAAVVRTEGGDDVFGVDARADEVLLAELARRCGERWPGTLVCEGFDESVAVGDPSGPWRYIADPVDGSRPWLWSLRSAWCLLGAGRGATTLAELEVSACAELPTPRAAVATTAWAVRGQGVRAVDDDVLGLGRAPAPVVLRPLGGGDLDHRYVTVLRYEVGTKAALGQWEDEVLAGLHTYEDPYICTGGLLLAVASGRQAAAVDCRPALLPGAMASHPYDLAGWLVAAEAGAVVEGLDGEPLDAPLDTSTRVAWAAYANEEIAAVLRPRVTARRPARRGSAPPATG